MFSDLSSTGAWALLFIAGLFEIAWVIGMKYSNGFSRLLPSTVTAIAMALSVFLLSQAIRSVPIGVGYAVWTGIGAVGAVVLGSILFNEHLTSTRIVFIGLIVVGIVGLRVAEAIGGKG